MKLGRVEESQSEEDKVDRTEALSITDGVVVAKFNAHEDYATEHDAFGASLTRFHQDVGFR